MSNREDVTIEALESALRAMQTMMADMNKINAFLATNFTQFPYLQVNIHHFAEMQRYINELRDFSRTNINHLKHLEKPE